MILNTNLIKSLLVILACTCLLVTCSNEKKKILDKETVVQVLGDMMLIENMSVEDSTKVKLIYDILHKYDISIEKLEITIGQFEDKPEYWQDIYTQIKESLKENTPKIRIEK